MINSLGNNKIESGSDGSDNFLNISEELKKNFLDSHIKMQNELLDEIKKDKPFSGLEPFINYDNVKYIIPLGFHESSTGEVFRIEMNDGKKYKLRKCRSRNSNHTGEIKAKDVDDNIKGFLDVLPKYHGKQNEYLLFDRIDGLKDFGEMEADDRYHKLGELLAKVHANQPSVVNMENANKWINKRTNFDVIKNDFTKEQFDILQSKVANGLSNPNIKICLELWDLTPTNLKFTADGKLLLIDEESVGFTIKGIGLGKALKYRDVDMNAIKTGYESILASDYIFEKDFLDFANLLMLLNTMRIKKLDNNDYSETKKKILDLL